MNQQLYEAIRDCISSEAAERYRVNCSSRPFNTTKRIDEAFIWSDTPEGRDYWHMVAMRLPGPFSGSW